MEKKWHLTKKDEDKIKAALHKKLNKEQEQPSLFALTPEEVETVMEALLYTKGAYDGKIALWKNFRDLHSYKQASEDMEKIISRIKQWFSNNQP